MDIGIFITPYIWWDIRNSRIKKIESYYRPGDLVIAFIPGISFLLFIDFLERLYKSIIIPNTSKIERVIFLLPKEPAPKEAGQISLNENNNKGNLSITKKQII